MPNTPLRRGSIHRLGARAGQRGAALLTAMIIVTLVVTLSASMVWQQWRAVQVEAAERGRTQAAWILVGALDWARLILRADFRSDQRSAAMVDHLGEAWAVPLAEARLSTFLAAADKEGSTDDGLEAFLSGAITDAQSRFNVANLVNGNLPDANEVAALGRLCATLGVDSGVAGTLASGMLGALGTGGGASAPTSGPKPLRPKSVSQLAWLGVNAQALEVLRPYLTVLPERTAINVNTASREVLSAEIPNLDLGSAEALIQRRQRSPFKNPGEFTTALARPPGPVAFNVGVNSSYFEVRGRLRLVDRVLEERSLVHRGLNGQVDVVDRERVSSRDEQPTS